VIAGLFSGLREWQEHVTPTRLFLACGVSFALSSLGMIGMMFIGMGFFGAQDSEVPWFYPLLMLATGWWILSGFGMLITIVTTVMESARHDQE
jgi:hypothetical protein